MVWWPLEALKAKPGWFRIHTWLQSWHSVAQSMNNSRVTRSQCNTIVRVLMWWLTHPKFNIAPQKMMVGRQLFLGGSKFSRAMLSFHWVHGGDGNDVFCLFCQRDIFFVAKGFRGHHFPGRLWTSWSEHHDFILQAWAGRQQGNIAEPCGGCALKRVRNFDSERVFERKCSETKSCWHVKSSRFSLKWWNVSFCPVVNQSWMSTCGCPRRPEWWMINNTNWITKCCCVFQSGSWFAVGKCGIYWASGDLNENRSWEGFTNIGYDFATFLLDIYYNMLTPSVGSISVSCVILSKDCTLTLNLSLTFKPFEASHHGCHKKHREGAVQGGIVGWLLNLLKGSWTICRFNSQTARAYGLSIDDWLAGFWRGFFRMCPWFCCVGVMFQVCFGLGLMPAPVGLVRTVWILLRNFGLVLWTHPWLVWSYRP